jgi:hypothetical protein
VSGDLFSDGDPFDLPLWQQAEMMADAPPRPAKGYIICPQTWLGRVWPRVRSGRQLAVLMLIYRRCLWAHRRTVSLPNKDLAEIGISRQGKYTALNALEELELIKREPYDGKATRVTLLAFP